MLSRSLCVLSVIFLITNIYATVDNTPPATQTQTTQNNNRSEDFTIKTKATDLQHDVYSIMSSLTPTEKSALEERLEKEKLILNNPFGVSFYKPSYLLPVYYTGSPYHAIYEGVSPDDQKLKSLEFKGQLSLQASLWNNILGKHSSLNVAFSQVIYWQFYAKSQYFREINCDAEAFIQKRIIPNWWISLGAVHQSNGRGGDLERSWNRAYIDLKFSGEKWMVSLKPWVLIFKPQSTELHNPDIAHYLGYGSVVAAYKIHNITLSLMWRNLISSGFKRPSFEAGISFPIHNAIKLYIQGFSGYGQSLIEYDHHTNSVGIGISFSDWI